jgi:predicted nucleic acid-binding protein
VGWVTDLFHHTVAIDTAPVIAFIATEQPYAELVQPLFAAIAQESIHAITATITLAEVMVRPLREKNTALAQQYQAILLYSRGLTILPLSEEIALQATALRAEYNLRMPDAIQVATALIGRASTFITNDKRLRVPPSLTRILLDDLLS